MKLGYKIGISFIVLTAVLALGNHYSTFNLMKGLQTERMKTAEVLLAKSLSKRIYRDVIEQKVHKITDVLFSEKNLRENKLEYILIYDKKGYLLAHTYIQSLPKVLLKLDSAFTEGQSFSIKRITDPQITVYNIAVPIMEGIKQVGTIHMGIKRDYVENIITPTRTAGSYLLIIILIVVGLGIVVAALLSKAIVDPITKLQDLTENISQGDLSVSIDINSKDEIGNLAASFNQMMTDLKKSRKALEKHSRQLEAKVSERTKELDEKVDELERNKSATLNMMEDLSEVKTYIENVLKSFMDTLIVVNMDGMIQQANMAALDLLGYAQEELSGANIDIICSRNIEFNKIKNQGSARNLEVQYRTKNNTFIPMLFSGSIMKDEGGNPSGMVLIAKDITELKKAEADLKIANEDLIRNEKSLKNILFDLKKAHDDLKETQGQLVQSEKLASLGQLSAGVAHEINNPVGFISSNLETLEGYIEAYSEILRATSVLKSTVENKDFEKAQNMAEEITRLEQKCNLDFITSDIENLIRESKSGTERIKKIVQDLRTFARKDEGQMELNSLEDVLEGVINIVWNEIKYKAELKKEYNPVELVRCNPQKLGQVFINLLVNAAQSIPENGEITLKLYQEDTSVCVDITDTGSGISEENINKIFDPFFTTKEVGKGTGLGLSVSYDIVKQHRGEMKVKSEVGKGTTFTIQLPV